MASERSDRSRNSKFKVRPLRKCPMRHYREGHPSCVNHNSQRFLVDCVQELRVIKHRPLNRCPHIAKDLFTMLRRSSSHYHDTYQ